MTIQSISVLIRSAVAACTVALLPSCVVYDDYYGGSYDVSVGYSTGDYYVYGGTRYYYPAAYPAYTVWSPAHRYYYGGRYYSYPWWNDHRYRHYRHDHRNDHRHRPASHVHSSRKPSKVYQSDHGRHDRGKVHDRRPAPPRSSSKSRYSPPVKEVRRPAQVSHRSVNKARPTSPSRYVPPSSHKGKRR